MERSVSAAGRINTLLSGFVWFLAVISSFVLHSCLFSLSPHCLSFLFYYLFLSQASSFPPQWLFLLNTLSCDTSAVANKQFPTISSLLILYLYYIQRQGQKLMTRGLCKLLCLIHEMLICTRVHYSTCE